MTTLTAVSVDRLLALMLGLRYRQAVTMKRVWIFVVTSWLLNAGIAVINFNSSPSLVMSVGIIEVILCLAPAAFCYLEIYLKLLHHKISVQDLHVPQGQPNRGGIPLNMARYKKTVSSALWVQMALLACYLPGVVIAIGIVIRGSHTPSLAFGWTVTLSVLFVNSSLKPFLYCWKIREVRQAGKDTIKQFSRVKLHLE